MADSGESMTKLVAEIGSCWKPEDKTSITDAIKAALDCGADLVKLQVYDAVKLAWRRGVKRDQLLPWALTYRDLLEIIEEFPGRVGASFFDVQTLDSLRTHCSFSGIKLAELLAFAKSATQEYQWAALAKQMSYVSVTTGVPLFVSVPSDGTMVVGNYLSPEPITWLWCEPFYPANEYYLDYRRLESMGERLPGKLGVSDHTSDVSFAASILNRSQFKNLSAWEKHFCYNESLRGKTPDAGPWSLSREKFEELAGIVHGA